MRDTIPPVYFYFFWLCEPLLSIAGAVYAIFRSKEYAADMLPEGVERFTAMLGSTIRGEMLVAGLGNCFLVLALVSLSILPIIKTVQDVTLQEKLFARMMLPLGIADITHIIVTLRPLPRELLLHPESWSQLIHGNVDVTIVLFIMRLSWLFAIGRPTAHQLLSPEPSKRGRGRPKKLE